MALAARRRVVGTAVLAAVSGLASCQRSPLPRVLPDASAVSNAAGPVVCVEVPDGCVFCAGKDAQAPFLEPEQSRPLLCDPQDEDGCVEFCSLVTPACALPWSKTKGCLVNTELEFRRALFNLRSADRPEGFVAGRVVDEAGRRIEGARIRVWLSLGGEVIPLVEEATGKDGNFRIPLRSGPWSYSVRVSYPGRSTAIADRIAGDRLDRAAGSPPRLFRLAAEQAIRGRVVDLATGLGIPGVTVSVVRTPGDAIQVAEATSSDDGSYVLGGLEARRYLLNASKFGWRPLAVGSAVAAPAQRVVLKLLQGYVIRGTVVDSNGEAEPSATVAAVLASAPALPNPPIVWTTDALGRFAEDRFVAGTYYLWARRRDMLAYPPSRIELSDSHVVEVRMALAHRGSRVAGRISLESVGKNDSLSIELISRSPLAFPRNPAAKIDAQGSFLLTGVLPGRYRFDIKTGIRSMAIVKGPREVEVPIEPGSEVTLSEPVTVRPRAED
jgi:Carboxypeptidase regulatory-like domain